MQSAPKTRTQRLKTAGIIAVVSLPVAVLLIAYANHSLRQQAIANAEPPVPGGGKEDEKPVPAGGVALKLNELHTTKDGITVKVVEITDSRCPAGAQCVWAGNAGATLELSHKDLKPATVKVNSNIQPREAVYAGNKITLLDLTPRPGRDKAVDKAEYVVTLQFSPATGETQPAPDLGPAVPLPAPETETER